MKVKACLKVGKTRELEIFEGQVGLMSFIWKMQTGVKTNSATATNCVSLYDLRGIH